VTLSPITRAKKGEIKLAVTVEVDVDCVQTLVVEEVGSGNKV